MAKFKVITSNPSNEGKTFVTKINRSTTVKTFVGDKVKNETYYISGSNQLDVDTEVDVDLNIFNVMEHPFETSNGDTMQLKWLHLK